MRRPILGGVKIWSRGATGRDGAARDASCRDQRALTQHDRDFPPTIDAPQPDLSAGHETEQQDQRRILGREGALRLDAPAEFFVEALE